MPREKSISPHKLRKSSRDAHSHSKRNRRRSSKSFGCILLNLPFQLDSQNTILDGQSRRRAMRMLFRTAPPKGWPRKPNFQRIQKSAGISR